MITKDQIVAQISETNSIFELPEVFTMIKNVASLTATYYKELIDANIPAEHAALITAHYSANVSKIAG